MVIGAFILSLVAAIASLVSLGAVIELTRNGVSVASLSPAGSDSSKGITSFGSVTVLPASTRDTMGKRADSLGLPMVADSKHFYVLIVSPRCATCADLMTSFKGQIPASVRIVVTASEATNPREWVELVGIDPSFVQFDVNRTLANRLLINTSPVVVSVIDGDIAFSATFSDQQGFAELLTGNFPPEAFQIRNEQFNSVKAN